MKLFLHSVGCLPAVRITFIPLAGHRHVFVARALARGTNGEKST
jgi:hypothetical protein